jgi:hypothetical protein
VPDERYHLQGSGRKQVSDHFPPSIGEEEGCRWIFDKELLILEEFVETKTLDEYEFDKILIWVTIYKIPLGIMSKRTSKDIGDQIGKFMEVDGVENGMAMGQYLRVKVRISISKPLMRGTMVEVDDKGSVRCLVGALFNTNIS